MTLRGILLGLLLLPPTLWWLIDMEEITFQTWPSMYTLPLHVVAILLLLVGINALLRRWVPRFALSQAELLTIYVMLAIASTIAGWSFVSRGIGWIVTPLYRASKENRWGQLFTANLPDLLIPKDTEALRRFFEGRSSFWEPEVFKAWLKPLAAWSLFITAFMVVMLGVNLVLRRRWIEHERLTFPVAQLPLELTREDLLFFRSPRLWLGFGLAGILGLLNGLNYLLPTIPKPPTDLGLLAGFFQTPPWNALVKTVVGGSGLPVRLHFWAIGLGVLMPLDGLFSLWGFFWLMRLFDVAIAATGWDVTPQFPYYRHEAGGALVAFLLVVLWGNRRYLRDVWQQAVWRTGEIDDATEPFRYRTTFLAIGAGTAILAFLGWISGMSPWVTVGYLALYFAVTLAVTRARAEIGGLANETAEVGPDQVMMEVLGPNVFSGRNLTLLSVYGWAGFMYGQDPIPHQLEGLKLAERTRMNARRLVGAMLLAGIVATPLAFIMTLIPFYHLGVDSAGVRWDGISGAMGYAYEPLANRLTGGETADIGRRVALGAGFLLCLGLAGLKSTLSWWPFHPLAFSFATNWFTYHLWPSMIVSWLAKLLLLHYGGRKAYTSALPFFLGLILGDAIIGSFWAAFAMLTKIPVYSVWI